MSSLKKRLDRLEADVKNRGTGVLDLFYQDGRYRSFLHPELALTPEQVAQLRERAGRSWLFARGGPGDDERSEAEPLQDGPHEEPSQEERPLTHDDCERHNAALQQMSAEERDQYVACNNYAAAVSRRIDEAATFMIRAQWAKQSAGYPFEQWVDELPWPEWLEKFRDMMTEDLLYVWLCIYYDWEGRADWKRELLTLPMAHEWLPAYRSGAWDVEAWKRAVEELVLGKIGLTREVFEADHMYY